MLPGSMDAHSPARTVPNTPSPQPPPQNDIARLVPSSAASQKAFEEVVRRELTQFRVKDGLLHWESAPDGDKFLPLDVRLRGHYRFNFQSPHLKRIGWTLGSGYGEELPTMHFPACIPGNKDTYRIGEKHARFTLNEHGILMLHAGRRRHVRISTQAISKNLLDEEYPLTAHSTVVSIGPMQYIFEYLNWGRTALYWASLRGLEQTVRVFLDKGADVNAGGRDYGNALQAASYGGYTNIVQMLRDKGADATTFSKSYK